MYQEIKVDEDFKKTERLLYDYFNDLKEIEQLEAIIKVLEADRDDIKNKLGVGDPLRGIDYSRPKIQTNSIADTTEQCALWNIEQYETRLGEIETKIRKYNSTIIKLRYKSPTIKAIVSTYGGDEDQIITLKYKEKLSMEKIADAINWSMRTTKRKRNILIQQISGLIKILS
jgi:DNA repair ATPase RecN